MLGLVFALPLACLHSHPLYPAHEGAPRCDDIDSCSVERECVPPDWSPGPGAQPACFGSGQACSGDADCVSAEVPEVCEVNTAYDASDRCSLTKLCRNRPCAEDGDCGSLNVVCLGGRCERRSCKGNDDCDGYCVAGACYLDPGFCIAPSDAATP
jgi:hypothetical protein